MIAVNKSDMKYWEAMCKEKGINPSPLEERAGVVLFDSSAWVGGDRVLEAVKAAVMNYYAALDARKHGGVAAAKCVAAVEAALGMKWERGASLSPPTS